MASKERTLEQRITGFIRKHELLSAGGKVVVAVSGGADSVSLLHLLAKSRADFGVELHVAHLNHQLRGAESDADAEYVRDLAGELRVPATIESRDVLAYHNRKGGSLEEAAREVRYSFLAEVASREGSSVVALGHTRDDNVETILMHLLRGAGLAGLRGLQPRSVLQLGECNARIELVRPMLEVTRQEAWGYCQRHGLKPRSDSSNLSPAFVRNRIRLELLPVVRTYNQGIDDALLRLAAIAGDALAFIDGQVSMIWKELAETKANVIYLNVGRMAALPRAMQRQAFRKAVQQLLGNLRDIEAQHIEAMVDFLAKPAGKKLCLPRGVTLTAEYGRLVLTSSQTSSCPLPTLDGVFSIKVPGETVLPGWHVTADVATGSTNNGDGLVACFDLDRVGTELTVRRRRPGDRFQPLGMREIKKLQDFMVDSKIPRSWRDRVPLVCSPEGILWVVGWRIDDRFKVTENTRNILRLKFERSA